MCDRGRHIVLRGIQVFVQRIGFRHVALLHHVAGLCVDGRFCTCQARALWLGFRIFRSVVFVLDSHAGCVPA